MDQIWMPLFDARHMNDPNEGRVLAEYLGRAKGKNYNKKARRR